MSLSFRSSHQRCSVKKGVLRNFSKFTGKHRCQGLFFTKVAGLRPENTFFTEHLWKTVSDPSRPNLEQRKKINLYFYFRLSLWWLKRGLKGLHKIFLSTAKMCENKNLNFILIQRLIIFKVNNKDTTTTPMASLCYLYC